MFSSKKFRKVKIWQPKYRERGKEDFEKLIKRDGLSLDSRTYRQMLDMIEQRDYVESSATGQSGDVLNIIRDRDGFPVCLEICGPNGVDYLSVDRVDFWEQYTWIPNTYGYYGDDPNAMCWEWEESGCQS